MVSFRLVQVTFRTNRLLSDQTLCNRLLLLTSSSSFNFQSRTSPLQETHIRYMPPRRRHVSQRVQVSLHGQPQAVNQNDNANNLPGAEEEDNSIFICTLTFSSCGYCKIVGIRYYTDEAHPGEFVRLEREPSNPYDANAIRVDNLHGRKVGHIARQAAAVLAPVMDQHKHLLTLDASIPFRGSQFHHPLQIEVRAQAQVAPTILATLRPLYPILVDAENDPHQVRIKTMHMDWRKQQKQLDDLWEEVTEKQLKDLPPVDIPKQLLRSTLFPHQVQALQWLVQREKASINPFFSSTQENGKTVYLCNLSKSSQPDLPTPVRGGLLADDMGLGKSLSMIALVLTQPPPGLVFAQKGSPLSALPFSESNTTTNITSCPESTRPITLIVCPVSVLHNWQDQFAQHVIPDAVHVALYQGPQRQAVLDLSQLSSCHVIVTSYATLLADYRRIFGDQDDLHKFEEPSQPSLSKKRKTTKRKNPQTSQTAHSIFDIPFFRVILDEAHVIRNPRSQTFLACAALQAHCRWCLTGTPLTNKPEDIAALWQFLQLQPFHERDVFRRAISQPIKDGQERGLTTLRLAMAYTALRRTKAMIQLPKKHIQLRLVDTNKNNPHQKVYQTIYDSARAAFGAAIRDHDHKVGGNFIFEILTRLRQSCCSGTLVSKERIEVAERVLKDVQYSDELTPEQGRQLLVKLQGVLDDADQVPECAICMEEMSMDQATVIKLCGHVFCGECLQMTLRYKSTCAFCRRPYQPDDLIPYSKAKAASFNKDPGSANPTSLTVDWDGMGPSPKMQALLLALSEMKADEKGVVFSQFTRFLDQLEDFLTKHGWQFTRIDGSRTIAQRVAAMHRFQSDDPTSPRLILCSLHAAGTGVNLTRGNHVFLMDTWWNKAVEQQAQDRIHRLGQDRSCRIVRFVAADSIESRMVELQEAKAALGKGAFENLTAEEKRKARMEDLKRLLEL